MRGLQVVAIILVLSLAWVWWSKDSATEALGSHQAARVPRMQARQLGSQSSETESLKKNIEALPTVGMEPPPAKAEETPEQKRERLAQFVASEEFFKKVLDYEKIALIPELKEDALIEEENIGEYYSRRYKVGDDQEVIVNGSADHYSEALRDKDGNALVSRLYNNNQLRQLQVQMGAKSSGAHHTFVFDAQGGLSMIYSDMDGVKFTQKFAKGKVIDRTYLKEEGDSAEMVAF